MPRPVTRMLRAAPSGAASCLRIYLLTARLNRRVQAIMALRWCQKFQAAILMTFLLYHDEVSDVIHDCGRGIPQLRPLDLQRCCFLQRYCHHPALMFRYMAFQHGLVT